MEGHVSCCGVNLACAWFRGFGVSGFGFRGFGGSGFGGSGVRGSGFRGLGVGGFGVWGFRGCRAGELGFFKSPTRQRIVFWDLEFGHFREL
jgi:hypothetical protein